MRRTPPSGWLAAALVGACGFLVGVLFVVALGGEERIVRERTITVPGVVTNGGTVITKTEVPDVVGERLDTAQDRIARAGFDPDVDGGGLFGVVVESNWEVVEQQPRAGRTVERGSSVKLRIDRR